MLQAFAACLSFRFMPAFPYSVAHEVPLFLAPMAGVSESPFRRLCRRFGADVVVTEFLSAEGIRRENEATLSKLRFGPDERPIGVQIFGGEPGPMGEAAALVTDVFQPEFIDINFGCPVKKVVRRNGGSGCLKISDLVQEVIRAVAQLDAPAGDLQDSQRLERRNARSGDDRAPVSGRGRHGDRAASAHAYADVHGRRALGRDREAGGRARYPGDRQRRHQDGAGRAPHVSRDQVRGRHDCAAARSGNHGFSIKHARCSRGTRCLRHRPLPCVSRRRSSTLEWCRNTK